MDLSALHHPLFQSFVLPLLLSLAGIGLVRAVSGPTLAAAGVGLAVLLSTIWLMGWSPRPGGLMERLPWIVGGAWLVGVALSAALSNRRQQWLVLTITWLLASWWLGTRGLGFTLACAFAGVVVIGCLVHALHDRADGATAAVVASLGLAALTFVAGSLALFQLSLLLAAALGGAGLWLWPKARIRFGAAGVAVAAIGWLALAQASLLLVPVRPEALGVLAAAFVAAPLLKRFWPSGRTATVPLAVALLAASLVAGALALHAFGPGQTQAAEVGDKRGGAADDAYYVK